MGGLADDIISQQSGLAAERSQFDIMRQEVAELVLPDHAWFTVTTRVQGEKRAQKQYDSTAQIESGRHASAIDSLANPHSTVWGTLQSTDAKLNERDDVRTYYDDVNEILFRERYAPRAGFASQIWDVYRGGGVFGDGTLMISDQIGGGLRYRSLACHEVYYTVDAWGNVDKLHRKFKLTARAAVKEYGKRCPPHIAQIADKEPLRKFEFIHAIYPNAEQQQGYMDARGMPFMDCEVEVESKMLVRQGGYHSWPTPVYRYDVNPGEWYGRGWACQVLAEIKQLNRARKAQIRQTEKAVDPPWALHDDGLLSYGNDGKGNTPSINAGAMNLGLVSVEGKLLAQPMMSGADLATGEKEIEASRSIIKDASLTSLFQILIQNPQMTATEYLGRMQEKGQLIAPMVGRALATFLGGVVERELEILSRQGKLPPPPMVLQQAGTNYRVEYNSPLAKLQKIGAVEATSRWLSTIEPYVEFDKTILDNVDFDAITRGTGEDLGVPQKYIRDQDAIVVLRQKNAQQAAVQQTVEAAPQVAGAMKDVATAQQLASQTGAPAQMRP